MKALPLIGPVTALEFTENHLLAGIGPWLHLFDLKTNKHLSSSKCLPGSKIHGMRPGAASKGSALFCLFGQKFLRIASFEEARSSLQLVQEPTRFDDWIWDVAWVTSKAESTLAVAQGHNCVQLYDWRTRTVLESVQCEEICILYCARFLGTCWADLVLAAGTVFNQVVIWAVCGQKKEGFSKVLYRLGGHQGVIFSIAYHPSLQYLCSVSDDRSLQLWKLASPNAVVGQETKEFKLADWSEMEFTKVYRLYGHTARVWNVQLLDRLFITIGEDSTTCVWDYAGQVVQRFKGHRGKSIWSVGVHPSQNLIATGGGDCSVRLWDLKAKGKVNPFTSNVLQLPASLLKGDFPRTIGLLNDDAIIVLTNEGSLLQYSIITGNWKQLLVDEAYRSYSVLSPSPCGAYAALGNISGGIKIVSVADSKTVDHQVFEGKIHSIEWLVVDGGSNTVLVSGPDGKIVIYELLVEDGHMGTLVKLFHDFTLPYCKQRWVTSAILLPEEELLVCGDRGGTLHVYDLSDSSSSPSKTFLKVHGKSGVSHVCFHDDHVYSCGRDGKYVQYSLEDGQLKQLNANKVAKGFEWLCQLLFTDNDTFALGFHTVNFELWSLNTNQKMLEIECGGGHRDWDFCYHDNQAVFVYIKKGDIVLHQGELRSNQQIIKPPLHGRELTDVKHILTTGNVHVLCTSSEDTDVNIVAVEYNEEGNVTLHPLKTLQGHLSNVRCLALSSPKTTGNVSEFILFSAGGRAQLKSWRLTLKIPDCVERFRGGNGAKQDCVDEPLRDLKLGRANSGAGEISLDKTDVLQDAKAVCNSLNQMVDSDIQSITCSPDAQSDTCSPDVQSFMCILDSQSITCSHELLSTHMLQYKSKKASKPWKKFEYDPSLETRFMALSCFCANEIHPDYDDKIHFISAACSDGFLRLFKYCVGLNQFKLLGETEFHDHCLLCVEHLITGELPSRKVLLLSAGTDGRIAFWDITKTVAAAGVQDKVTGSDVSDAEEIYDAAGDTDVAAAGCIRSESVEVFVEPSCVIEAHQSGVNALAVRKLTDDVYLLASGGDDNALVLTEFCITDSPSAVAARREIRQASAHATQITGIRFIGEQLMTISIDQRAVSWKWSFENKTLEICEVKFVDVADISSCDHWRYSDEDVVVLSGTGLQLLRLPRNKEPTS
ncbi:tRNA (34-2'-O)-methyltransferase regulator WDR6-like [Lineus longissimus]|uniref:tRNA (34-2'-O)-methyltransferase regulator WDR6-like n=1 Tax=Lineus longissimus TaxID=88925 RepID=UPI002B4DC5D6